MKRTALAMIAVALSAAGTAEAADYLVHVGGMCSQSFGEGNMSGLPGYISIDARATMIRTENEAIQDIMNTLDQTCPAGGENWCRIYAFSNGAAGVSKMLSVEPANRWNVLGVMFSGSNEGGSVLADNGTFSEWFGGCPLAREIGPTQHRRGWNHHDTKGVLFELLAGNDAYEDHKNVTSWLYLDGEDDGAVAMDSAGAHVNTGDYDNICAWSKPRWEFHVPFSSVSTTGSSKGNWIYLCAREKNHDEMKQFGAQCLLQHFSAGTACRS